MASDALGLFSCCTISRRGTAGHFAFPRRVISSNIIGARERWTTPFQLARSQIFDERYRHARILLETKQAEVSEVLRSSIDEIGEFKSLPEDLISKHIWEFAKPYFGDVESMEEGD